MEIRYTEEALTELAHLPNTVSKQVMRKIARLKGGLVGDIKPLKSFPIGFRLRSGELPGPVRHREWMRGR